MDRVTSNTADIKLIVSPIVAWQIHCTHRCLTVIYNVLTIGMHSVCTRHNSRTSGKTHIFFYFHTVYYCHWRFSSRLWRNDHSHRNSFHFPTRSRPFHHMSTTDVVICENHLCRGKPYISSSFCLFFSNRRSFLYWSSRGSLFVPEETWLVIIITSTFFQQIKYHGLHRSDLLSRAELSTFK